MPRRTATATAPPPGAFVVRPSARAGKKWTAQGTTRAGRRVTVHFGARGYQDYTQHRDAARKARYILRHRARENWTASGAGTPGFWSRWLLWNKPSLRASAADAARRFRLRIRVVSRAA
jgi:hypothetical protein